MPAYDGAFSAGVTHRERVNRVKNKIYVNARVNALPRKSMMLFQFIVPTYIDIDMHN